MALNKRDRAACGLVAKSCRMFGALNLTKNTLGHISQRTPDGEHFLVRETDKSRTGAAARLASAGRYYTEVTGEC